MSQIIHKRQVTEEEEEETGYAISREEWNEGHIIEIGSARIFIGPDVEKDSVSAVEGNLYLASDIETVYAYTTEWLKLPLKGDTGPQGIQGPEGPSGIPNGRLDEIDREIHDLWGAIEGYPPKPMPQWEDSLRLVYEIFNIGWLDWIASSRLLLEDFDGWFEFIPSSLIIDEFDGWFPWEGEQILITEDFEGGDW